MMDFPCECPPYNARRKEPRAKWSLVEVLWRPGGRKIRESDFYILARPIPERIRMPGFYSEQVSFSGDPGLSFQIFPSKPSNHCKFLLTPSKK
jgi:hypothetical protein